MGHVARKLEITTVHYSDVENGRKPAFPVEKRELYERLGEALKANPSELMDAAMKDRGEVKFVLSGLNPKWQTVMVRLARYLSDLSPEEIDRIDQVLSERDRA